MVVVLEENRPSAEAYEKVAAKLRGRKRPEIGEKVRKANLGRLRTPVVERECPMCGSVFQTRTNTMGRKFCSGLVRVNTLDNKIHAACALARVQERG